MDKGNRVGKLTLFPLGDCMIVNFVVDVCNHIQVLHNFIEIFSCSVESEIRKNSEQFADVTVCFNVYKPLTIHPAKRFVNRSHCLFGRRNIVNICNNSLVDAPTFPGDYLIRKSDGHGNQSNPTRIRTKEDVVTWCSTNTGDYVIQHFIDTELYGKYYSGRICRVGNSYYPLYACSSKHWNTNLHAGFVEDFDDSSSCFRLIPNIACVTNFHTQIHNAFEKAQIDLGCLDFSIHEEHVIVWEVIPAIVFEVPNDVKMWTTPELDPYKKFLINGVHTYLSCT
jgi:hypothetical protein